MKSQKLMIRLQGLQGHGLESYEARLECLDSIYLKAIQPQVFSNREAMYLLTATWKFYAAGISSVQFSHSVVSNTLRPHGLQHARPPCSSWSSLRLTSIKSVMPSNHLILCCPLLLLPLIFLSISAFSNESVLCIRQPEYWSFSFDISPSNEHPGLISFRMDQLDLLAVQGTLKSLLQQHSSKLSILWQPAFFLV